jgi:hypothetical protein
LETLNFLLFSSPPEFLNRETFSFSPFEPLILIYAEILMNDALLLRDALQDMHYSVSYRVVTYSVPFMFFNNTIDVVPYLYNVIMQCAEKSFQETIERWQANTSHTPNNK